MATRRAMVEDEPEDEDMGLSLDQVPTDRDYNIRTGAGTEKASTVLAQLERKKFAASIAVPTDDAKVRVRLRAMGEPITLFGEGNVERRDRLRELLTRQAEANQEDVDMTYGSPDAEEDEAEEEYYTEGSDELLKARHDVARFSLPRAQKRLNFQKAEASIQLRTQIKHRKAIKEKLAGYEIQGSQVAAERPLASVRFAPDGKTFATGTWGGSIKLLDMPNLADVTTLRGHMDVVSGLSWMPGSTLPTSTITPTEVNLASGGGDGHINLWSLEQDTPLATLTGHDTRVSKVDIHPSRRYLASASHDMTWRLWDLTTQQELQVQEGHSREVHCVSFNHDGSLVCSGGWDSLGRIWDVRTGKMIMFLDSHIQPVYCVDWGADGHRVLTGSADGYIKVWDLRVIRETGSIGAHTGGVNDMRWFRGTDGPAGDGNVELEAPARDPDRDDEYLPKKSGTFVVSTGFDKKVCVWSADDWALCRSMQAHNGNVTGVDVTNDAAWIVSCSRDRTVKIWGRDDGEGI